MISDGGELLSPLALSLHSILRALSSLCDIGIRTCHIPQIVRIVVVDSRQIISRGLGGVISETSGAGKMR